MHNINTMKRLLKHNHRFLFIAIAESVANFMETYGPLLVWPFFLQSIIDRDKKEVFYGFIYVAVLIISGMLHNFIEELRIRESINISEDYINRLYIKLCRMNYTDYNRKSTREKCHSAIEKMYYDFDVNDLLEQSIVIVENVLSVFFAFGLMITLVFTVPKEHNVFTFWAKPVISIFSCVIALLVALLINKIVIKKARETIRIWIQDHGKIENRLLYLQNNIIYNFQNYISYSVYGMHRMLKPRIEENAVENIRYYGKMRDVQHKISGAYNITGTICMLCAFLITMAKTYAGAIPVVAVVTYTAGIINVYGAILKIQASYNQIRMAMPYFEEIERINNYEDEADDKNAITLEGPIESIRFDHVSFKYPNAVEYAVLDLSFEMKSGATHALVGRNGSGKTTLVLLLLRFLAPETGKIYVNGINIEQYNIESYRKAFSVVFQDMDIYPIPLNENIAFSKAVDESRVKDAMLAAGIKESYRKNELGRKYSGGEKQHIALASVYYKNRDVYILDEPTASMDVYHEDKFYESCREHTKNHFVLFVSHRMSSCRLCEDIIVLNDGKLVQRGNHLELVKTSGIYQKLWDAQAKTGWA